jgi:hypothetical protein
MTDDLLAEMPRVTPAWLAIRGPADAAARATDLVPLLGLADAKPHLIHDLGCGTGSMGRWLAPRLAGPQHWVLHDRDPQLLDEAAVDLVAAADGAPVTAQTRCGDLTALTAEDFAGATLVTASALFDLLTAAEVERIAAACVGAGCPALLTLSVTGRVELTPPDPLDRTVQDAFNDHQRREVAGRRLLGPDALAAAVAAFSSLGVTTVMRPSPWRLGPTDTELLAEWFTGWVDAAVEQRPELAGPVLEYAQRRRTEIARGRLRVVLHHLDLLAGRE